MTDKATQIIADALTENLFNRLAKGPSYTTPDEFVAAMRQEAENVRAALAAARIELIELRPQPHAKTEARTVFPYVDLWADGWASDDARITLAGVPRALSLADAKGLVRSLMTAIAAAHTDEAQHTAQER